MAKNTVKMQLTTNDAGQHVTLDLKLDIKMDHKNALLFILFMQLIPGLKAKGEKDGNLKYTKQSEELMQAATYLNTYMAKLNIKKIKGNSMTMQFDLKTTPEEYNTVHANVQKIMANVFIQMALEMVLDVDKKAPAPKEYKQSRTLARTVAYSAGKDTQQRTLFDIPLEGLKEELERQIASSPSGMLTKEVMSKKTGMLAQALMSKYDTLPKDKEGYVIIEDISLLAKDIFTDMKKLKYFLLYLGGYQYTHVAHFEDAIGFKMAKMFDVWMMYDKNREAKIDTLKSTIDDTINIIRDERIKYLRVKPTAEFIRDLQGKGLGFIRVTDGFLALCNDLSLMAYKIFNYSATQRPLDYSITEDKLLEHLNLKDQVKKQGRPRVQAEIKKALEELTQKDHFKKYKIEERLEGNKYTWTYSDSIVKHNKQQEESKDQEYIDYKDTSVPIGKRRDRYQEYLVKEKKLTKQKAREKAEKIITE